MTTETGGRPSKAQIQAAQALDKANDLAVAQAAQLQPDKVALARRQARARQIEQLERALEAAETDKEKAHVRRQLAELRGEICAIGPAVDVVTARVLKMGDGKVSTGEHFAGVGSLHYERGDTFQVSRPIAEDLETRGYVEIQ